MAELTRQQTAERTRRRLLDVGRELFSANGFHATKIDHIARAAGFTRGAFYAHFHDKDDFFLSLLEDRTATQAAEWQQLPDDDPIAAAQAWLKMNLGREAGLAAAAAEFAAYAQRHPHLSERLTAGDDLVRAQLAEQITRIADPRQLPVPAEDLATIILAIGEGLAAQHLDPERTSQLFGTALAWLVQGIAQNLAE